MANLQELDNQLGDLTMARISDSQRCGRFVKLTLIIGGSAFAGVAHFITETQAPSVWHIAGIAASIAPSVPFSWR